jgi:hypothetical protein
MWGWSFETSLSGFEVMQTGMIVAGPAARSAEQSNDHRAHVLER